MPIHNPRGIPLFGEAPSNPDLFGDPRTNALAQLEYQERERQTAARAQLEAQAAADYQGRRQQLAEAESAARDMLARDRAAFDRRRAAAAGLVAPLAEFLSACDDVDQVERQVVEALRPAASHLAPPDVQQLQADVWRAAGLPPQKFIFLFNDTATTE